MKLAAKRTLWAACSLDTVLGTTATCVNGLSVLQSVTMRRHV